MKRKTIPKKPEQEYKNERKNFLLVFLKNLLKVDRKLLFKTSFIESVFFLILFTLSLILYLFLYKTFISISSVFPLLQDVSILSQTLQNSENPQIDDSLIDQVTQSTDLVKNAITKIILSTSMYLIVLLFVFSFFKGMIWSKIKSKEFTKKFFWKFLLSTFLFFFLFLMIFCASIFLINLNISQYLVLFEIIVLIYLIPIFFALFEQKTSFFKILCKTFKLGFVRLHQMVITYIIVFAVLIIFMLFFKLLSFLNNPMFLLTALTILSIIFYSFSRIYIYQNICFIDENLNKKEE